MVSKQTHFDSVEYSYDDDGNPIPVFHHSGTFSRDQFLDEEDLTNIFDIAGEGYDVTLSLAEGRITWKAMVPKNGRKGKSKGGIAGLFKGPKSLVTYTEGIDLNDVYGAKVRRRRRVDQKEGEGFCLGFGLFTYERKETANLLKDKIIFFEHPSEEVATKWVRMITKYMAAIPNRPKTVKLFMQDYAGQKNGRFLYKHMILPMFKNADVSVDMTEVQHNEHIKQEMVHINLEDFDCIVACGGDGTASRVAEALLNRTQKDADIELKPGFSPNKCRMPLGIIPIGITNQIAGSVMGTVDQISAILHIIYGHTQSVDICSVYAEDKFLKWSFNSQYGFAGNVLSFRGRYSSLGPKKMDLAFMKALTKAKLRSYACDIEYIPAPAINTPVMNTPCNSECNICWTEEGDDNSVTQDLVQELDPMNPLADSASSGSLIEMNQDTPWKTVKGKFMNVGILSISGRSEFAPNGLSKFTHLCDGNMDLVLVKETDRKEFIRFLKRHGNSKNQFDFPFVEVHRVREVRFRPRLPTSWNYKDHSFNEIDYEMSKLQMRKNSQSAEVLNEIDIDDETVKRPMSKWSTFRRADSVKVLSTVTDSDIDDDDDDFDDDDDDLDGDNDLRQRRRNPKRRQSEPVSPLDQKVRYVGPQYRKTFMEAEREKRAKKQRKKEEKAKLKEESRMKAIWNIDNEMCHRHGLDFKIHHALLKICGEGVSPETEPSEVTMGCLQIVK